MDVKRLKLIFYLFLVLIFCGNISAGAGLSEYDIKNLPSHPRLLLLSDEEEQIKQSIEQIKQWENVHKILIEGADKIIPLTPTKRVLTGKRLLDVSREVLRRTLLLGYAYRITKDVKYSNRIERELLAVANFENWNPSHFLDVAEMTLAIAIGYDWIYQNLSDESKNKIKEAILNKGLLPSLDTNHNDWLDKTNNWNQVCNSGVAYGAAAIAEDEPELALHIIERSIKSIQFAMSVYAPKGAYPEGYSYWSYGTAYNVLFIDMLEKIFNSDFGLLQSEGFLNTPEFMLHMIAPSNKSFNYGDNKESARVSSAMFWFAKKTQNPSLLYNEFRLLEENSKSKLIDYRLFMPIIIWGCKIDSKQIELPSKNMWVAQNTVNPIGLMRTSWSDKNAIFLGFKAGTPAASHAHMDIGSFVMEADGVRWAMDFDYQDYNQLESLGMDIWSKGQESDRWRVFRNNNYSHNTLTVDNYIQRAKAKSDILHFSTDPDSMGVTSDISSSYFRQLQQCIRSVGIINQEYVYIQDHIKSADRETLIRWSMLTPATPEIINQNTIRLTKSGKRLLLKVEHPGNITLKTWSTEPTTSYDAANPGTVIVGFELTMPANTEETIVVKLISEKEQSSMSTQEKNTDIYIYPNPVYGYLSVKTGNINIPLNMILYNNLGETVYAKKIDLGENLIEINLPAGSYICCLYDKFNNLKKNKIIIIK